jgi:hypothetical protein
VTSKGTLIRATSLVVIALALVACGDNGPSVHDVASAFEDRGISLGTGAPNALPPQTYTGAAVKTILVGGSSLKFHGRDPLNASPSPYSQVEVIFTNSASDAIKAAKAWSTSRIGAAAGAFWVQLNAVVLLYSNGGSGGYARATPSLARTARAAMKDLGA